MVRTWMAGVIGALVLAGVAFCGTTQPGARRQGAPASQRAAADEGTLGDMAVAPSPFSPAFSPGKLDKTWIGFRLTRLIPVTLRLYQGDALVRTVPASDVPAYFGLGQRRYEWNGLDDAHRPVADGRVVVKASTCVQLNWRLGNPAGGHEDRVIHEPHALAVDAKGNLYLSATDGRIRVFNEQGELLHAFGPRVAGLKGTLGQIRAMAFAPDGKLVIFQRSQIVSVSPDGAGGKLLWPINADLKVRADWLDGMAVSATGRIYLACASTPQILVFEPDGTQARSIGSAGTGDGQFTRPGDVAVAPDGTVYATDMPIGTGRVLAFSPEGKSLRAFETTYKSGPIPMGAPRGITVLSDGSIVVAEGAGGPLGAVGNLKLLARLSPEGKLLSAWGTRGGGEGELAFISRLASYKDQVFAAEHYDTHRVVRMDAKGLPGKVLATYQTPVGIIVRPTGIAKIAPDRYLIADPHLARCTVVTTEGAVAGCWPLWPLLAPTPVAAPIAICARTATGDVFLLHADQLLQLNAQGRLVRKIRLQDTLAVASDPPGLYVHPNGRVFATDGEPGLPAAPSLPNLGAIRVFDDSGKLADTLRAGDRLGFFGAICVPDESKPDSIIVQQAETGKGSRAKLQAVALDVAKAGSATACGLDPGHGIHPRAAAPFAAGGGLLLKGGHQVTCLDSSGRYLWSLGSMQDKPLQPAAMLLDGQNLLCVNDRTGHVESWWLGASGELGQAELDVDNTPPTTAITDTLTTVVCGEAPMSLLGTAWDPFGGNFQKYMVYYRPAGHSRSPNTARWQAVRSAFYTQSVRNGVLAEWKVSRQLRDTGLEVKVIAWDTAGNSNESEGRLVFDDDQDGLANELEVARGTDPRKPSTVAGDGAVQVQAEIDVVMTPYFFANWDHSLRFAAYDVRDPNRPKKLEGAVLTVHAAAGTLKGGTADASGCAVATRNGAVVWTAPNVDSSVVAFKITFGAQSVNEVTYKAASADLELEVQRDDDRDWLPDSQEAAPGQDYGTFALRGNADSDGDGVPDGYDIAPRQSYNADTWWSSTYAPGMIRYEERFAFLGIGGGQSHVTKYGSRLSGKNIMRSEAIYSSRKLAEFLNGLLFHRTDKDPAKRKPYEVVDWLAFGQTPPEQEEKLGVFNYGGSLHPDFYFHYYTLGAGGTAIIENVDEIDGKTSPDAGIHREYLKVTAAACDDYVDRKVTIQWKLIGQDPTRPSDEQGSSVQMAWFVEAFVEASLKGRFRTFSSYAVAQPVGDRLYQATVEIPGEDTHREIGLYLKLTPCKIHRTGGSRKCTGCGRTWDGLHDSCDWCGASLKRYGFTPLDRSLISVSGVCTELPSEQMEWVRRQTPRAGIQIEDDDVFDQIRNKAAEKYKAQTGVWPPMDTVYGVPVDVGGKNYHVTFCSIRGLRKAPKTVGAKQADERMKALADNLSANVNNTDVICLVANDYRHLCMLGAAINWGPDGVWKRLASAATQPSQGTGAASQSTSAPSGTPDQPAPVGEPKPLQTPQGIWENAKASLMIAKDWVAAYNNINTWAEQAPLFRLDRTDLEYFVADDVRTEGPCPITGRMIKADTSVSVQKQGGGFLVQSRSVLRRPCYITKDPVTGARTVDKTRSQVIIQHRKEFVSDPAASKVLKRGAVGEGTHQETVNATMNKLSTAAKVLQGAAVLVTNGMKIYSCYTEGDYVGVGVYTIKAGGELWYIWAQAKQVDNVFVSGLRVAGTAGAKISLVGVAIGVLETGHNVYLITRADNPIDKQQAVQNTVSGAFDAGLAAFEPWGGLILASWSLGANIGKLICYVAGMEGSPISDAVVNSPGSALTFIPLEWLPGSVPAEVAQWAAFDAQEAAVAICDRRNLSSTRTCTYLFVPPAKK